MFVDTIRGRIIPAYAGSTRLDIPWPQAMQGSSPHTRGAPFDVPVDLGIGGIIPAYAGSTELVVVGHDEAQDHPRIRGEHAVDVGPDRRRRGSSPHTRGARAASGRRRRQGGIIPAYAGSTAMSEWEASEVADHPRIRGEHSSTSSTATSVSGSSPHTRGAQLDVWTTYCWNGIIPAYAGSTCTSRLPGARRWDHPRIRGEHTWKSLQYQGSPP